ncbi:MAG: YicC family protein [Verrucomicrobiota bacterium]|nr:YicC family protein [Verrucomicrobiota bacterium]
MTNVMSMTGCGAGAAADRLVRVDVELSSVNRKQLDVSIGLPRFLLPFESRIHQKVQKWISRGRITGEIRVTWTAEAQETGVRVDEGLAKAQVQALRVAAEALGLPDDLKASVLLSIPDVLVFDRTRTDMEEAWPTIEKALELALERLCDMRRKEGAALAKDVCERLMHLETLARQIGERAPRVTEVYRRNLLKRISEALPGVPLAEDERLLKEVAVFADRSDITEERVRLASHVQQARELLASGGVAGRTLDFLAQEMGREINTIGSKANDGEVTRLVIDFKAELERSREQIQNIE